MSYGDICDSNAGAPSVAGRSLPNLTGFATILGCVDGKKEEAAAGNGSSAGSSAGFGGVAGFGEGEGDCHSRRVTPREEGLAGTAAAGGATASSGFAVTAAEGDDSDDDPADSAKGNNGA